MKKVKVNRIVVVITLMFILSLSPHLAVAGPVVEESSQPSALEMTIRRFFEGQGNYQAGDLITRSQVEELQGYLRKTGRRSPASHPVILRRFLPDRNRLCKVFYLKNGGKVLRAASLELGGYAEIEALARKTASYTQLVKAVRSGQADTVVELVKSSVTGKDDETLKTEEKRKRLNRTIYTVDDFIKVVIATSEAKTPAEEN